MSAEPVAKRGKHLLWRGLPLEQIANTPKELRILDRKEESTTSVLAAVAGGPGK